MKNLFVIFISAFFILSISNCFSQTPVYPTRDSMVNIESLQGDITWFPYTPVKYENGVYEIYYRKNYVPSYATSPDGINWTYSASPVLPSGESIVKKGNIWYLGYHTHYQGNVYFNTTQSNNGINFPAGTRRFVSGEDISFFQNNDSFYCYIRPKKPQIDPLRKIGLMKSADFQNWSPIQTILTVDSNDYNDPSSPDFRKQLYSMSVFKVGNDFWGLMNVYRIGDNGEDVEQLPPYDTDEHTVEVQLVYSKDGINWKRTNSRNAFIPRTDGIKQCFGLPTVANNKLMIYTIETDRRHTDYESANRNGRYFKIWRYQMNLSDLETWKPPTNLELKISVEGLLNENNQHNENDTVNVYLRRIHYPYAVIDSATGVINKINLKGNFEFKNLITGRYFISVKGRNFIETWSKLPQQFTKFADREYDFTSSRSQAYGNNMYFKNGMYCFYSGDIDQSGNIELFDVVNVINDQENFSSGLNTDLNGDGIVDLSDVALTTNNTNKFIIKVTPE